MCDHQNGTRECRGDGYLWDADRDGWHEGEADHPCPACNTAEFLRQAKEYAETTSDASCGTGTYSASWTGADWWRDRLAEAVRHNPEEARAAETALCPVHALIPADDPEGYAVEVIAASKTERT